MYFFLLSKFSKSKSCLYKQYKVHLYKLEKPTKHNLYFNLFFTISFLIMICKQVHDELIFYRMIDGQEQAPWLGGSHVSTVNKDGGGRNKSQGENLNRDHCILVSERSPFLPTNVLLSEHQMMDKSVIAVLETYICAVEFQLSSKHSK